MYSTVLFPSDFFNKKIVDKELSDEYEAALETGFDVVIFSYDDWFDKGVLKLNTVIDKPINAIYRGWMMTVEKYELFYKECLSKNIRLITDYKQYCNCHLFPNSYDLVEKDTAKMKIYPLHDKIDIKEIRTSFDRFMVKDYVKSVKGSKFPKYFKSSISQEEFDYWMCEFYKYRGDLLSGGICIKEYLDLKKYDGVVNEYRVFYLNGKVLMIVQNDEVDCGGNLPPLQLVNKYSELKSDFYTIDYAELIDGNWKVIECGDGQVSGILSKQSISQFYRSLYSFAND